MTHYDDTYAQVLVKVINYFCFLTKVPGMVVHVFNPSPWKLSVSLRLIYLVSSWPARATQ